VKIEEGDLSKLNLSNLNLSEVTLTGVNLHYSDLRDTTLSNTKFIGCNLEGTIWGVDQLRTATGVSHFELSRVQGAVDDYFVLHPYNSGGIKTIYFQ
jgi:uncharacterized protein YjbI with pentapeptide repeats